MRTVGDKETISVLGTEYEIFIDDYPTSDLGKERRFGYCTYISKEIHVADISTDPEYKNESEEFNTKQQNIVMRHEIIHAFFFESGLRQNSGSVARWAENEEMVDWLALQWHKIQGVFDELGI